MGCKRRNLEIIEETGIFAILRLDREEDTIPVARCLYEAGVHAIEVTMSTPNALGSIAKLCSEFGNKAVIGVGTALDAETARMAILAGAEFVVSPVLKPEIIAITKRYTKISVPGAFTPTEILNAWELGADIVKVFPATTLGPGYFRDIKGPLPQVNLSPTGGVTVATAAEFIKAGAYALGVGSALTDKKLIAQKDWDGLGALAQAFLAEVKKGRER